MALINKRQTTCINGNYKILYTLGMILKQIVVEKINDVTNLPNQVVGDCKFCIASLTLSVDFLELDPGAFGAFSIACITSITVTGSVCQDIVRNSP